MSHSLPAREMRSIREAPEQALRKTHKRARC
jgi:hypothetical protein